MKKVLFVGSSNNDAPAGLRVFEFDCAGGALAEAGRVEDAVNPIYLALSADGTRLYAAQKLEAGAAGGRQGGIVVYAVDGKSLSKLGEWPCAPTVPCHVSISRDGRRLYYAEYSNAHAGVFNIAADGMLEGPVAEVQHKGGGPNKARQDAAHCHYAAEPAGGGVVCVCDLGIDRVVCYKADCEAGAMREVAGAGFRSAPGAGPRHMAFHPGGKFAFLLNELDSTVVSLRDSGGGVFSEVCTVTALPSGFDGESKAAAIKISPDGKWVLASNRGHDSIAAFAFDAVSGAIEMRALNKLGGEFPRDFEFSPDGAFVVVGHKLSDEIAVYAFDAATGGMAQTKHAFAMRRPLCFVFAR